MTNYIVKNCPAFCKESYRNLDWAIIDSCIQYDCCCKEIYNCLIKRIIDKCKSEFIVVEHNGYQAVDFAQPKLVTEILNMFEIEDCEDADI